MQRLPYPSRLRTSQPQLAVALDGTSATFNISRAGLGWALVINPAIPVEPVSGKALKTNGVPVVATLYGSEAILAYDNAAGVTAGVNTGNSNYGTGSQIYMLLRVYVRDTATQQVLIANSVVNGTPGDIDLRISSGNLVYTATASTGTTYTLSASITTGWHDIEVADALSGGGGASLTVDGVQVASNSSWAVVRGGTTFPFTLLGAGAYPFNGLMAFAALKVGANASGPAVMTQAARSALRSNPWRLFTRPQSYTLYDPLWRANPVCQSSVINASIVSYSALTVSATSAATSNATIVGEPKLECNAANSASCTAQLSTSIDMGALPSVSAQVTAPLYVGANMLVTASCSVTSDTSMSARAFFYANCSTQPLIEAPLSALVAMEASVVNDVVPTVSLSSQVLLNANAVVEGRTVALFGFDTLLSADVALRTDIYAANLYLPRRPIPQDQFVKGRPRIRRIIGHGD